MIRCNSRYSPVSGPGVNQNLFPQPLVHASAHHQGRRAFNGAQPPLGKGGPAADDGAFLVAAYEFEERHWQTIARVARARKAIVRRFDRVDRLLTIAKRDGYAVAVVALETEPECDVNVMHVISHLRDSGLSVIAHADGLGAWSISARCHLLLAGAKWIIDTATSDFETCVAATLLRFIDALMKVRNEDRHIWELASSCGIVGDSESLLGAFRQTVRISKLSDLPVLIRGESGTGKELFAGALHSLDPKRSGRPFVPVNCAVINAGVAECELFGHVRGAFTGATQDREGYFLAAQGGVVFLDEIGELSLDVQAKMLRVLQERRLVRVGAPRETPVDVRVIAATNRDLAAMVREARFREDLFHRLNGLRIHISPLRERPSDLPVLVRHFVDLQATWCGDTRVGSDLIDALSRLLLRGNVRELRNIITAALACKVDASPLGLKDLPREIWQELTETTFARASACSPPSNVGPNGDEQTLPCVTNGLAPALTRRFGWNLDRVLSECEREMMEAAMEHTGNNQSRAANLLGITPRSVYNKLHKHGLLRKTINLH